MILKLMIMEMIFSSNNTTTFDEYNRSMATMAEDQELVITEDNGRRGN